MKVHETSPLAGHVMTPDDGAAGKQVLSAPRSQGTLPFWSRLIVVSNREPYAHQRFKNRLVCQRTDGGLTAALDASEERGLPGGAGRLTAKPSIPRMPSPFHRNVQLTGSVVSGCRPTRSEAPTVGMPIRSCGPCVISPWTASPIASPTGSTTWQ